MFSRILPSLCLFCLPLFPCASAVAGEILYVDDDNETGLEDGSALNPFTLVQAAINEASEGGTVLVAQGLYIENVVVSGKALELRGGFAGGSSADYAGALGGDFSAQDPALYSSIIQAQSPLSAAVKFELTSASGSMIDGFRVTGGNRGIELDVLVTFPHIENLTISRNIVEMNGIAQYEHRGGGLYISGAGHLIEGNIVRNNISGRGAAMELGGENLIVRANLMENNIGYSDHAGAINQYGTALIERNVFRANRTGETLGYGWGGAVLVLGQATLRQNIYDGNHAPSVGGAVFVDDGGVALLDHELMYANTAERGAAVYVDGYNDGDLQSHVDIVHCTIADNVPAPEIEGSAIVVEQVSSATVMNSIIWGNGEDEIFTDGTSSIDVNYTNCTEAIAGSGNLSSDPLFADVAARDYHLRSTAGRWDQDLNGGLGGFVPDLEDSPCIDAGNPISAWNEETTPNGGRVNMGAFGNTPEASLSTGSEEGEGENELFTHTTDQNQDGRIDLTELLRVIQLYNSNGFHCDPENPEDGFSTGPGDTNCTPYAADYESSANFRISLSELLRVIQIFNSAGYAACPGEGTEDGYCITI